MIDIIPMKTIKKQFEFFKKCCLEYINQFELNNWTFRFFIKKDKRFDGAFIERALDNCQADIYLDPDYKYKDYDDIKKSAKHEVIHCLIGKSFLLGKARFITQNELDREEEELAHKLEKLL